MSTKVKCGKCQAIFRAEPGKVQCPACRATFRLAGTPATVNGGARPVAPPQQDGPQMTVVQPGAPAAANPPSAPPNYAPPYEQASYPGGVDSVKNSLIQLQSAIGETLERKTSSVGRGNTLIAVMMALAMTVPFYFLVLTLRGTYVGRLFWGWIPATIVYLTAVSISLLLIKFFNLSRQAAPFRLDLLPMSCGPTITAQNVTGFQEHIQQQRVYQGSFLVNRLLRGLGHFATRNSVTETDNYLTAQSDVDYSLIHASFGTIKLIIWVLPILGFVGTVIGISGAVGGFSGAINGASEISIIKESLGEVTTGLAFAFDTTLLALVMSIVIMFPKAAMLKAEQNLLIRVEMYCRDRLCPRLEVLENTAGATSEEILLALQKTVLKHQSQWQRQCDQLATNIADRIGAAWIAAQQQVHQANKQFADRLQTAMRDNLQESRQLTDRVAALQAQNVRSFEQSLSSIGQAAGDIRRHFELLQPICERSGSEMHALLDTQKSFVASAGTQIESLSALGRCVADEVQTAATSLSRMNRIELPEDVQDTLTAIQSGNASLEATLEDMTAYLKNQGQPNQNGRHRSGFVARWFGKNRNEDLVCQGA